ncbi:glycolytic enzyme transcriptional activator [Nitzschia inconspicua]|uniref:Glycolytic enzyme transcriptional activator n=1 Tax=Nitzschia inconspicua TaxID=303405 RepID=A0A9K3KNW8_9STRA|nr:glycolytic enzyme transcriptional activator [Nitzschia inconspicua]
MYPLEAHKYHLTSTKVYRFMWYVAFREKKPTGGRKRRTESNNQYFDLAAYNAIICDGLEELSALMEASSPSTSPRCRPDQQINEDPPVDSRPFIMHPKHASIHNMYCEWHGISPFADPQGGVVGRNKTHGNKWRNEFNPNHYSRTSRIMKAVDYIISSDNLTWQNAVARLEPL